MNIWTGSNSQISLFTVVELRMSLGRAGTNLKQKSTRMTILRQKQQQNQPVGENWRGTGIQRMNHHSRSHCHRRKQTIICGTRPLREVGPKNRVDKLSGSDHEHPEYRGELYRLLNCERRGEGH